MSGFEQHSETPLADGRRRAVLARLSDFLETLVDGIGRWASWAALVLVVLVAINVILRYAFRIGPVSLQELEWHLISPIALIGIAYAMRHGAHVQVDILYEKFPIAVRTVIDLAAALATAIISAMIIKLSLGYVEQSYVAREISPDPGGLPFRFLLKAFIPLGFALLLLQALAQVGRNLLLLIRRP